MIKPDFFLARTEELKRALQKEWGSQGKWNIRHNAMMNYNMCKAFTGVSLLIDPIFELHTDKAGIVVLTRKGETHDQVNETSIKQ